MYVFIPEHFSVRNINADSIRVYAQTYLCRGVRFFSTQGRWVVSQTYSHQSNADSIHWLYLLYTYNRTNDARDDVANALVFRENARIIVEITDQIKHDTIIRARFHNISSEEIVSLTDCNSNYRANTCEPLDLSVGSLLTVNIAEKKIASRKKQMLPCDLCGKEFDRPSLLKRHIRTHTGERPHVCDVCGKGFSTSSSLNTHKRIHSGERPHQCGICGKRFTASSNLYYHRLTHSTEKPHKCDICGKSFPTPGNLRSHKYSHGGLSPYKCTICLRVFTKQTNLTNHVSLHKH